MMLSSFDDLLRATRTQQPPQRLLFVFAAAGVPDDATPAQRARVDAGEGGTLTPLMSVDKDPDALASFAALRDEARRFGPAWDLVFVAALAGAGGRAPTAEAADAALQRMVGAIESGRIGGFAPFDRDGRPVQFG